MSVPAEQFLLEVDATPATLPLSPLSTKLYPPRLRANLVNDRTWFRRLNDDPDRRLTLICAPAGYGKSTLVAQWLTRSGVAVGLGDIGGERQRSADPSSASSSPRCTPWTGISRSPPHALLAESRSLHADEIDRATDSGSLARRRVRSSWCSMSTMPSRNRRSTWPWSGCRSSCRRRCISS